ncbi:MAG: beta strand repeat-containing protein, partial [Syntrophothermus sp.]
MRKLLLSLLVAFLMGGVASAQISGTFTIPGATYPTIASAIAAINTSGIGSGGATFNITAGYTETFTTPTAGYITTNTATATNPVIFQKSGAGANPKITAGTGTGTLDAIICFAGVKYITFDGIDVQESPANTTATTQMEWGYALLKVSGTQGSQNITIKNCTISLSPDNTSTYGFYSANHTTASSTTLTVTAASGANSNNKFYSNTIQNSYGAVYLYGYADASPYVNYDQNNEIGKDGPNTVINVGNPATPSSTSKYVFYIYYQNNLKVANNTISGTAGFTTGSCYNIYISTANNSNIDLYNNTVSLNYPGTGSFYGIYVSGGSSGTTNTVNIYNNSIINNTLPNATSGTFYMMYITTGGVTANCYGNSISNNTIGSATATATGSIYYLYFASSPTTAGTTNVYNNTIQNNSRIQSVLGSGTNYVLYTSGSGNVINEYGNVVNNITLGSSSTAYVAYNLCSATTKNFYNNTITNILNGNSTIYSLYNGNGGGNCYNYNNTIRNINMASASGTLYGVYQSSGTNVYYYNNYISELKAPIASSNPSIYGIYVSGGSVGAYNNTVYLNASSSSSTFGAVGMYASTSVTFEAINNLIINVSTPGATGRVVAYQRSTTTLTSYSNASNNNDFYAGVPGASNLIFYDGTNSDQTLAAYKLRVSPRDAVSVTENPPFVNVTTAPYNLHLQTTVATQVESGGATVATPVNITTDFDNNPRYPNAGYPNNAGSPATAPDMGADEFGGIVLDLMPPTISYTPLLNTSSTSARVLTTIISDPSGVPTSGTGLPRLYWKINSGTWNSVAGVYVSGTTYTFTFGAGAVLGDVISYYIVAQDSYSTPNVGSSPLAGAAGFTANPPAAATPPTTPNSYTIVGTICGTKTIGTGGDYTTLTAAIADLNSKEISCPVVFSLLSTYSSATETFPMVINSNNGSSAV